jgi:predicted Zn finger-like uncharacterized protein
MPIRVTCPSCHARFNVSDHFAGKEGPCPKCKTAIKIPDKTEEVVIAVPDDAPKDSAGRSILKPIGRKETSLSSVQITLIAVSVIGFLLAALMLRTMYDGDTTQFPKWIVYLAAIAIAPPIVFIGYTFLRNQDLGSFKGKELWYRILICSAVYALLWLAMPLGYIAFNDKYDLGSWMTALIPMLAIGGATGMYCLDLDYIIGLVHYGLYLGICLVGRWLAGIGALPGMIDDGKPVLSAPAAAELLHSLDQSIGGLVNAVLA